MWYIVIIVLALLLVLYYINNKKSLEMYNKQIYPPLNYFTADPYSDELYYFYDPEVTGSYYSHDGKRFDPDTYNDKSHPLMDTVFGEKSYVRYYPNFATSDQDWKV
jgi:hypothetical protein